MSGLIVGLVLRVPISESFNTEAKFVATVYADHAWEDGTHAYPAVATVAAIVGLHPRTVQRYLRILEGLGMLVPDGKGPKGTNKYKFPIRENEDGSILLVLEGGGAVPPRQPAGGDTVSGDTVSGDTAMSPKQTTRPIVVVVNSGDVSQKYEQEFGALTPMIADAINDACETYPIEWILEAMEIAVKSNKRNWKYVEGILKNCKAKNIRPSLNRLENTNGNNNRTGNRKGAKQSQPKAKGAADSYKQADIERAAKINAVR